MSVLEDVERSLVLFDADRTNPGLAGACRYVASCMDERKGSPSECLKSLESALERLRMLAPAVERKGTLHDIKAARDLRLAGESAAAN